MSGQGAVGTLTRAPAGCGLRPSGEHATDPARRLLGRGRGRVRVRVGERKRVRI